MATSPAGVPGTGKMVRKRTASARALNGFHKKNSAAQFSVMPCYLSNIILRARRWIPKRNSTK